MYLDTAIPLAPAATLDIHIPNDDMGRIDDFIDDGIAIVPDLNDNKSRGVQALLLAIHILFRPVDQNENIPREDCLSLDKLAEEGRLSEVLTILGWTINTRCLTLSLPKKKFQLWSKELRNVISSRKASIKELEKIIGRLNHAGAACPLTRYFISGPRKALEHWNKIEVNTKVKRYLPKAALQDLNLWLTCFLPKIHKGISLNLISYRSPTVICWSDACPQGMGGYNNKGLAWRWEIPTEYRAFVQKKNNILEFIASFTSVWLTILLDLPEPFSCFLALGDNTSAVSWLHKASVDELENKPLHMATRKYAETLMNQNCCLYSQHIQGAKNNVADALSRMHNYSPPCLHAYISKNFPSQVPTTFHIVQLPQEISSWLISWLQKVKELKELEKGQQTKKREHGGDGVSTAPSSKTITTSTYKICHQSLEHDSLAPSQRHSEEDNFLDQTKILWEQAQSKRPWQNWVRSLGQTWGTTPPMALRTTECIHP